MLLALPRVKNFEHVCNILDTIWAWIVHLLDKTVEKKPNSGGVKVAFKAQNHV
jgi:hypothetical protein